MALNLLSYTDITMGIYCEDTLVPVEKKKGLLSYDNIYEEFDETEKLETTNEPDYGFEVLRGQSYILGDGFNTRS